MEFNFPLIAGAIPIGVAVSAFLTFFKVMFGLPGNVARKIVTFLALGYFAYISIAAPTFEGIAHGIIAGIVLTFAAGGFYDRYGRSLEDQFTGG